MQGGYGSIVWLVFLFGVMYFMLIRPQQKQKKQRQELLSNLEKGEKIVTIGGIHGTIVSLNDETMVLQVAPSVRLTMQRSAVGFVKVDEADMKESGKPEKEDAKQTEEAAQEE